MWDGWRQGQLLHMTPSPHKLRHQPSNLTDIESGPVSSTESTCGIDS